MALAKTAAAAADQRTEGRTAEIEKLEAAVPDSSAVEVVARIAAAVAVVSSLAAVSPESAVEAEIERRALAALGQPVAVRCS